MLFHWWGLDTTGHGNEKIQAEISERYISVMTQPMFEDCRAFLATSSVYVSKALVLWILRLIPAEWLVALATKLTTCFPFLIKVVGPAQSGGNGFVHSDFMKAMLLIKQHVSGYDIYTVLLKDARFALHVFHASDLLNILHNLIGCSLVAMSRWVPFLSEMLPFPNR